MVDFAKKQAKSLTSAREAGGGGGGEGCLVTIVPRFGVLPQRTPPTIIFKGEGPYTGPHFQWQNPSE